MDIATLRQQIDRVDAALLQLFQQRMDISGQIADYKKQNALPVFDPAREKAKLAEVAANVPTELQSAAKVLYSLLFELSRSCQSAKNAAQTQLFSRICAAIDQTPALFPRQIAIACHDVQAAQLEQRLQRICPNSDVIGFDRTQAVFSAVAQGMCRYGLLSAADARIWDSLRDRGFFIVRAFSLQHGGEALRYVLFGQELEIYPGADRTSLMLTLPNQPGSLYRVLARFYALGLNVAKLESRPVRDDDFHICFYISLETSVYAPEFARLMCELGDLCEDFHYLGSYSEVV